MPAKKTKVTPEDVTIPQNEEQIKDNTTVRENNPRMENNGAEPLPQTDMEHIQKETTSQDAFETGKETSSDDIPTVQTEADDIISGAPGFEDVKNTPENTNMPHTDAEISENDKLSPNPSSEEPEFNQPHQDGIESLKEHDGTPSLKDDVQSRSDTTVNSESDMPTPRRADSEKARLRITLPKRENIISIDEELGVVTDRDKAKSELLDLLESYRGKKHLSGKIQGIENSTGEPSKSLAVLAYGEYKVIIPLYEAVEPPDDLKGQSLDNALSYMLNKRLGAEIDYIVKGIDAKEKIVVGSRVEAMRNKRKNYYFGTDRDGNYILYSDLCAEVRVVSVVRSGIFVDLFGLEVFIPLSELSYQRMMDAESYFAPGQRTLVKILEVDRRDRRNLRVRASVKQAGENPYEKALRKYVVGNRYVGTVSLVDVNGVFVSLDGGIDCLCNYPKRGRPPKGARVTIRVLGINHNTNRMWGAITHIASAR